MRNTALGISTLCKLTITHTQVMWSELMNLGVWARVRANTFKGDHEFEMSRMGITWKGLEGGEGRNNVIIILAVLGMNSETRLMSNSEEI